MTRAVSIVVLSCSLGCACVGHAPNPNAPSRRPSAEVSASPSGLALAGVTRITFTGTGTDPEGRGLNYNWNFGDGASASGQTVTHIFSSEGHFSVVLTVANDHGGSTTAGLVVQSRSLSGRWTPLQNGVSGFDATIAQSGAAVSGHATNGCCPHTFAGEVSGPLAITLVFRFSGCPSENRTFVGVVAADLNTISLAGPNCNVTNTTYGFIRK